MGRFVHDKLEMWFGTPDAPAPDGTTERRRDVSVTVGVRPVNQFNTVSVRYRVDGCVAGTISAPLVDTDFAKGAQYFRATFPPFWSGERVEYLPVASCEGRRAPDPATVATFTTAFRLSDDDALGRMAASPAQAHTPAMYRATLEHLVHVRVMMAPKPELIGDTPAGFIVNWPPESGTLEGPAFRAAVIVGGEHRTIIRPDGIGLLSVSVTVRTHDGALIALDYAGTVDYGEDGLRRLLGGAWPTALPVRSTIQIMTSHTKYRWLNRLLCLGVGEVRPSERLYSYDMYAVR
jgi:uncharacterized protein DUF3237